MSGHSKWATIKRKKEAKDKQKGATFTKLIKAITVAVKSGGGPSVEANFKLKLAVDKAKAAGMPTGNVDNAIKKAAGQADDATKMEEVLYEGYGPAGVAIIVETLTDNRNRTAAEIRHLFSKNSGSLGESGCVAWIFEQKGSIVIPAPSSDREALTLQIMELAIEDVYEDAEVLNIVTTVRNYDLVKKSLEENSIPYEHAQITMIPKNTVQVTDTSLAEQLLRLVEELENNEDVQAVHANFDIPDDIAHTLT